MLYYELNLKCAMKVNKEVAKLISKKKGKGVLVNQFIMELNTGFQESKKKLGFDYFGARKCEIIDINEKRELEFTFSVIAGKKTAMVFQDSDKHAIAEAVSEVFPVYRVGMCIDEIAPEDLLKGKPDCKAGHDFVNNLSIPESTYCDFVYSENRIDRCSMSLEDALDVAEELAGDERLKDELRRIYSSDNSKEFIGHPVHYYLHAPERAMVPDMIKLLLKSLLVNKRIPSERVDLFGDIDTDISDVHNFEKFTAMSEGVSIVVECFSDQRSYADESGNYLDILAKNIIRTATNTLYIIVDVDGYDCFGKKLIEKLDGAVRFVKFGFQAPSSETLYTVLERMADKYGLAQLYKSNPPEVKQETKSYTLEEATEIFNAWAETAVSKKVYKAYADTDIFMAVSKGDDANLDPMTELERLVGLKAAKDTAKQIVAAARVAKARKEKGLNVGNGSLHMLFTGNPGSAKTTVARLIAKVLAKHGVTKKATCVECGRVDLVGKYVGWTANCVKDKFKEAAGGVLFIDEAYSLCGEGKDFGAEAISTIVQEMENHRDDVIVIFAGYPDKMEEFLRQNEGLRSRIPYHMQFPDYSEDELMAIMHKMAQDREYEMSAGFEKKCREKVKEALKTKDFGNGRFVRNLLEMAIGKQAVRITRDCDLQDVDATVLKRLKTEDFPSVTVKSSGKATTIGIPL